MNADMSNAEEAARTLKSGLDSRFTRARIVAIDPRSEADWQSLGTVITGPEDLLDAWREGGAFLIPLDPSIDALLITLAETGLIEVVDTTSINPVSARVIRSASIDGSKGIRTVSYTHLTLPTTPYV